MTIPILVAGGGLAGAAAAVMLAKAGRNVTVVERASAPQNKICGEFISAEAVSNLAGLGIDAWAFGGEPIDHIRLIRGRSSVTTKLPFTGIGLSRLVLDDALLHHAEDCGAKVLRGHAVRGVEIGEDCVSLAVDGLGMLHGNALLLATGKHDLRGMPRVAGPLNGLIGLKMYFQLRAPMHFALAGHVELVLFDGGYAGLQLIEGGRANLCLLVQKQRFLRAGSWEGFLRWLCDTSPFLAERIKGAVPLLEAPLSIARIPYGFMHQATGPNHIFRLGDQAGVIASFTGDGMAIALHSASLAVAALQRGDGAALYHRHLARDLAGQIKRADLLHRLTKRPAAQKAMLAGVRMWPGALALAARVTRVRDATGGRPM